MTVIEQRAYEAIIAMAKKNEPDYWTRLEHQYAGMAMQGILSHMGVTVAPEWVAEEAEAYATALVEKLKAESNEKTMY